jgi:hypothetical protein
MTSAVKLTMVMVEVHSTKLLISGFPAAHVATRRKGIDRAKASERKTTEARKQSMSKQIKGAKDDTSAPI